MKTSGKRSLFPLFQTPIDLAHNYWSRLIKDGNCIIDATCGNGRDTLFLVELLQRKGCVIAIDKQSQAIESAKQFLKENLSEDQFRKIQFYHQCHSTLPAHLDKESIALIVYNLGYLPGGNKNLTTISTTTLASLQEALPLIALGGAISITCYPGHEAGKHEEEAILNFTAALDPKKWSSCYHRWTNRREAPSLILIQRFLEPVQNL